MKKQRSFWMEDSDWRNILQKVEEQGFKGKGKLERFMEMISRERIIFIRGTGKIKISIE